MHIEAVTLRKLKMRLRAPFETSFGITRERIRQIQEQALEKMRERIEKRDPLSRPLANRGIGNM